MDDPAGVAQSFFTEFIFKDDLQSLIRLEISEGASFSFTNKVRVYRFTLVLMVLVSEEKKCPDLIQVRENLEGFFFGEQNKEGMEKLKYVKSAMKDLSDLLFSNDRRKLSWAMNWLHDAGVEESNPATLTFFSIAWMDDYILITKAVQKIVSM